MVAGVGSFLGGIVHTQPAAWVFTPAVAPRGPVPPNKRMASFSAPGISLVSALPSG